MKIIRYTLIAALVCCFALALKAIVLPEISYTLPNGTELSGAEIATEMHAEAITKYRVTFIPWLVMIGLILCGWIFLSRRMVVYGIFAASLGIFGYILYSSIIDLGYTMSQSISAALQGHGSPMFGWNWFYLIALIALPIATIKKAEQGGDGDADEAV